MLTLMQDLDSIAGILYGSVWITRAVLISGGEVCMFSCLSLPVQRDICVCVCGILRRADASPGTFRRLGKESDKESRSNPGVDSLSDNLLARLSRQVSDLY